MIEETEEEAPRGRARSRSFRTEEEEMMQRGVVLETSAANTPLPSNLESNIKNKDANLDDEAKSIGSEYSSSVAGSNSSSNRFTSDQRKDSNEKLIINNMKKQPQSYSQVRDVGALSQKTINSVKNIQDPAKVQQARPKTEAELAEEELERSSLAKGFITTAQYEYYVKILLLGDSGVGKTSLMLRFADNQFQESLIGTAGVDFKVRYLEKKGVKTKCQIWDTAGQEKFHVITRAYYRGAHGIALVYDACDINTFNKIGYWMENIKNHASEDVLLILLANKVDLPNRQVSFEQGKATADKHGYKFFETSAKTGKNVVESFETLSDLVISQMQKKEERHKSKNDSLTPLRAQQRNIIQGKKTGCCSVS